MTTRYKDTTCAGYNPMTIISFFSLKKESLKCSILQALRYSSRCLFRWLPLRYMKGSSHYIARPVNGYRSCSLFMEPLESMTSGTAPRPVERRTWYGPRTSYLC